MTLQAGKMYRPTDVVFDVVNDVVYVVEQFNHRVSKWNYTPGMYDFTLDASWGNNGDGTTGEGAPVTSPTDNALYRPSGLVYDPDHDLLYVTDTFHNRIRIIDASNGSFVGSVGQGGSGLTDFYHPFGIAINNADDKVVIADELNQRAVLYEATGSGAYLINPIILPDPSESSALSLIRPHGVIFDITTTRFDVTDSLRGLINRYSSDGMTFQSQFGTPGTTGDELFYPSSGNGLLNDETSTIFADTRNNNLKTVSESIIAVTTGTISGTGDGQLYYPESTCSFNDGVNYVLAANTLNNRVEAYSNVNEALTFESNFGSP